MLYTECNYQNGKLQGSCRYYYPDDRQTLHIESNYQDGKLYGPYKEYYPFNEETYQAEKLQGFQKEHNIVIDQIYMDCNYQDGLHEGSFKIYYNYMHNVNYCLDKCEHMYNFEKRGRIQREKVNSAKYYNRGYGSLMSISKRHNDKVISSIFYNPDGSRHDKHCTIL